MNREYFFICEEYEWLDVSDCGEEVELTYIATIHFDDGKKLKLKTIKSIYREDEDVIIECGCDSIRLNNVTRITLFRQEILSLLDDYEIDEVMEEEFWID